MREMRENATLPASAGAIVRPAFAQLDEHVECNAKQPAYLQVRRRQAFEVDLACMEGAEG
jgi:hypothetical protein